ncbi:MAG: glycerol-3-phosphate dehydrogenase [Acidobacteria bacterium]|nr:glycerol-3-phosphate dehydrogenase [Acidobacteriota bacterium]
MTRPTDIEATQFDALIIGAGINGAGIARDAALRGLKVLLVDKGDICGGTSGWSTRLIHGGLRYLEHGELRLVRESLRERERLLRLATHLVRPLPMLIPIYKGARRGRLQIRAGMWLYDLLSLDKTLARHRMLSRAATLKRAHGLDPSGLVGAALYYDAQVEYAERLVVENALSAREHGATVLTYARAERLLIEDGAVLGVELKDLLSGGSYRARASYTLNVAGPWVDEVIASQPSPQLIGGTKGSHLIVDKFPGAPADALYVEAAADGRPFFIIPWNSKYLIGTTDTRYDGDLDRVAATEEEISYLLNETNRVIPAAGLARNSVLYTYAGIRPLPFVGQQKESGITRRHFIHEHAPALRNFASVIGGKLTTYRSLAEEAVDLLLKKLAHTPVPSRTAELPLPGAETKDFQAFQRELQERYDNVPASLLERLFRIYGTRADAVLKLADEDAELLHAFDAETGAIGAELVLAFREEMAETLADSLQRRTMVGLNSHAGLNAVEAAARVARNHLGWSAERAVREVAAYLEYVERFHPASAATEATTDE